MEKIYKCECGRAFTKPNAFNGHKSHCITHLTITGNLQKRLDVDIANGIKQSIWKRNYDRIRKEQKQTQQQKKLKQWLSEQHTCEKCGKVMTEWLGSGRFCSRSCANSRIISQYQRHTISKIMKQNPVGFCAHNTHNIINNPKIHSKREMEIIQHLQSTYPNDDWVFGFFEKHNGMRLNPDVFSKKLKIVIEYDGIWHFKDIYGQLYSKQYKDRVLLDFINNSNYRLIRIDEESQLSFENLDNLIYNCNDKIILVGTRYDYLK